MNSNIIKQCSPLRVIGISALLFFAANLMAAENDEFGDISGSRAQRTGLPENGVNNLAPQTLQQQTQISRRQASSLASDRYEGRVLSIRLDNNNWRVRMDRDGTVFNVFVNANSGDVSAPSD